MCLAGVSWSLCLLRLHVYQSYVIHTQTCCQMTALLCKHWWPRAHTHTTTVLFGCNRESVNVQQRKISPLILTTQIFVFFYIMHNKLSKTSVQASRLTCILFPTPLDQRQYEPGAGLCVSAGELAFWQRVGLQKLRLCPHTPHTPHASGGRGQFMVVCNSFLCICAIFLCVFLNLCKTCLCVSLLVLWWKEDCEV